MAEALFRHYWFKEKRKVDLIVSSAGIHAMEGCGASEEVRDLLKEEGIDASLHHATGLTEGMIEKADLILVMTAGHKSVIKNMLPVAEDKIKLLKEFAGLETGDYDISDPFGGNLQIYRNAMQEIRTSVLKLIDKVEKYFL